MPSKSRSRSISPHMVTISFYLSSLQVGSLNCFYIACVKKVHFNSKTKLLPLALIQKLNKSYHLELDSFSGHNFNDFWRNLCKLIANISRTMQTVFNISVCAVPDRQLWVYIIMKWWRKCMGISYGEGVRKGEEFGYHSCYQHFLNTEQ